MTVKVPAGQSVMLGDVIYLLTVEKSQIVGGKSVKVRSSRNVKHSFGGITVTGQQTYTKTNVYASTTEKIISATGGAQITKPKVQTLNIQFAIP